MTDQDKPLLDKVLHDYNNYEFMRDICDYILPEVDDEEGFKAFRESIKDADWWNRFVCTGERPKITEYHGSEILKLATIGRQVMINLYKNTEGK